MLLPPAPEVVVTMVDVLEDLADSGPVLEFAVGTSRIAAPLAAHGLSVSGIELSRALAVRIDSKPGGDKVKVTIGDMTTRVAGQFSLAYLVFITISNVTTHDGQIDVFCNAATPLQRLPPSQPHALAAGRRWPKPRRAPLLPSPGQRDPSRLHCDHWPMAEFEVRPAQAGDAPALAQLFAAVARERDGIATEPPVDIEERTALFARSADGSVLAVAHGQVVGFLNVQVSRSGGAERRRLDQIRLNSATSPAGHSDWRLT
jgi:hypothetical protein